MELLTAYFITFGWALTGSLSMALALVVSLFVFNKFTRGVDEWALVREGNIPMGLVIAAVIIACGMVVSAAIRP